MKICIQCRQEMELERFYRHPQMADGHAQVCIECHKARMKIRRLTNPRVQEYDRA